MAPPQRRRLLLVQLRPHFGNLASSLNKSFYPRYSRGSHQSFNTIIQQKWFALPKDQRESLKSYIVNVVIEYGAIENISRQMHNILSKANSVLVQIVKYEWNTTWTTFINDICSASLKDMNLC